MDVALAASSTDVVRDVAALLEQGKLPDAVARAREALDDGVEAPLLLNLRAYWLEGQKRPREALADLERAWVLSPDDPAILNALGLCLARLGRNVDAATAFRKCAELAPEFAPAHFNSGWTLEDMGELDRARQAFEEAARLNPHSADPWAHLASLAARRGRWDETRTLAEKALTIDALQPVAVMAMANAELAGKSFGTARTRLQALIGSAKIGARERATATGLLGDVLDAERRYPEAFAAYASSNAQFGDLFAGHAAVQSEVPMNEYVAWLLESFARASPQDWRAEQQPPVPQKPAQHVFVLGFPRSGTTLLEEVLACHPDVATTGEKDALSLIVRELFAAPGQLERLKSLDSTGLEPYRARYWEALGGFGIKARTVVDKQPLNSIRLPLIAKLFPDARIVFCLRDPRDVVLSCFRRRFVPSAANMEFLALESAARLYDAVMRLAETYKSLLGLSPFEMRHEDFVADFEAGTRSLCGFLGLEWVDEFRNFAKRSQAREVLTPSATQIQRGLDREGIGHWRKYESEMVSVLPQLNMWAARLGYPAA